jgi:urease accessory protein
MPASTDTGQSSADAATLLLALQFGDSAFPAGGFAFSWGLEGLAADGLVSDAADVSEIIEQHLTHRWNGTDRKLLRRAHAAVDVAAAVAVDRLAEAATLAAPSRIGSRRAGRALLGVAARLGLALATPYRDACNADAALGHLAVVQGVVFRAAGLPLALAELLGGWAVISSLSSAAVRLGLLGHVEALAMAAPLRAMLATLLAAPPAGGEAPCSFTPLVDIAISRNTRRDARMFAT